MDNAGIVAKARKCMDRAASAEMYNREDAIDDLKNITGDQWPAELRQLRDEEGRPCITVNMHPQFLRQVTGDLRQMNPAINITPGDDDATKETAKVIEGVVRLIQYRSDASSVFERAAESAAACGMGFFRILADYEDAQSFNQEILIKTIDNPFSVYMDPDARMPTREDAKWWIITEAIEREDYEAMYPGKSISDVSTDGYSQHWWDGEKVIVAEYMWIEEKKAKLVMLADGRTVLDPKGPVQSIMERETTIPVIKWAKVSANDVLEGPKDMPGTMLPVVAIMGEELFAGDRYYRSSVIRHAKDPQRLYNYWWSAQTEVVALQPKSPILATPKQIAGHEKMYNQANDKNRPYILYNPDPAAAMPSRLNPPVASSGMMDMLALASQDMRSTTGIQNAALGQASNEKSGVAIRQRQMESDVSTSVYSDNMGKAIRRAGEIIVGMVPEIYDTTRNMRVINKDETQDVVQVNMPVMTEDGPVLMNDLSKGRYSVQVSVGPNYSTKRQEASAKMLELTQAIPAVQMAAPDLIVKAMDIPGADQIAERLAKMLPPGVAEQQEPDPQAQQMMQMQQQEQSRAQEFARIMQEMELRGALAKAEQSEAQAEKAKADAFKAQTEARMAVMQPQQGLAPA